MTIRKEKPSDIPIIYKVNQFAFQQKDESELIHKIRAGSNFVPDLSLVYEEEGQILGYILFSKIKIKGKTETVSLSLAPMAVLPNRQKQGIGSQLLKKGIRIAKTLGFESIIVLGHEAFYPKFGFKRASKWNLKFPVDVPDEAFMAMELKEGSLNDKAGMVVYPKEFGI